VAAGLLALAAMAAAPRAAAEEPKAPPAPADAGKPADAPSETLTEFLHGIRFEIRVPKPLPESGASLLLWFHDYTGNGKKSVETLGAFIAKGFVVAAPWSKQGTWEPAEVDAAAAGARTLCERYLVPRERRHVAGLSGGGAGVSPIAQDEDLGFATATWVCGTWAGGSVPKGVKARLSALFLWGAREGPSRIDRYRASAALLTEKVRLCVVRGEPQEPGLGRARGEDPVLPEALLPFWFDFLATREGKSVPGVTDAFAWEADLDQARQEMVARKLGGFAYVHAAKPAGDEEARTRALQADVFYDRAVRHFADQLVAVKIEKSAAKELFESAKATETPAIVVFRKGGREVLKVVAGEITAKALIPVLRAVAADQDLPR
jgi:hypothetical protein